MLQTQTGHRTFVEHASLQICPSIGQGKIYNHERIQITFNRYVVSNVR